MLRGVHRGVLLAEVAVDHVLHCAVVGAVGHVVASAERLVLHAHVHLEVDEEVDFLVSSGYFFGFEGEEHGEAAVGRGEEDGFLGVRGEGDFVDRSDHLAEEVVADLLELAEPKLPCRLRR